jgi:hypothetical protein
VLRLGSLSAVRISFANFTSCREGPFKYPASKIEQISTQYDIYNSDVSQGCHVRRSFLGLCILFE